MSDKQLKQPLPENVRDVYDEEAYRKWLIYRHDRRRASLVRNAVMSLRWHMAFFPVLGCLLALRTAMQAMGQKTAPILSSCIELGMKLLSAALLIPQLGFFGTSITEPITWSLMLLFLAAAYFGSKTWMFSTMATEKGAME